ncbi:hypothetical protein [Lacipirellula parvula]|uniref:PEP-CTERM protein-sorting domain-containing protein n=1 Tax=Lacipirellula parvula TaxID=2650471 RepID=A0A5K7XEZ6_9BACT|nr:hypothetical protein [Lacipirellula parvula]BBO32803.1 hypothetical protein PLANPX_2415 [Lacipirellula parvula]
MHKFFGRALLALLASSLIASEGLGDLLLYEGFDYPAAEPAAFLAGSTNPSGSSWTKPTSSPAGQYTKIVAGSVGYNGLAAPVGNSASVPRATPTTGEDRIGLTGQPFTRANGGSYFFSFTLQMTTWVNFATETGDAGAKNDSGRRGGFIGGLFGATTGNMQSASGFAAPIYIRREVDYNLTGTDGTPGAQTGRFELGIQATATPVGLFDSSLQNSRGVAYDETASYAVGDTILIVGEYKFVDTETNGFADVARLWINPTPGNAAAEATPTIVDESFDTPNLGGTLPIAAFHMRNDTNTPGNVLIDEIRVGTTFADVLPAAAAGLPGDFNGDEIVDGADFLVWQRGSSPQPLSTSDLDLWKANFGSVGSAASALSVPEPASLTLAALTMALTCLRKRRKACD